MRTWKLWHSPYMPLDDFRIDLPASPQNREEAEAAISIMQQNMKAWEKEQEERFEAAKVRISLCAFLHGFGGALDLTGRHVLKHYDWCPYDAWTASVRSA